MLQWAQLDTAIDQTTNNAEDDGMFGQWMAKPLGQNLELVQLSQGVFNHNAIFGKKTIVGLLFFSQGMVAPGFEWQIQFFARVVCGNAIVALIQHGGFVVRKFGKQIGLT